MKTYFVHLNAVAITVRTDETVETLTFRTKKQADKKLLELIKDGYKFDRFAWSEMSAEFVPTNDAEDRYNRA